MYFYHLVSVMTTIWIPEVIIVNPIARFSTFTLNTTIDAIHTDGSFVDVSIAKIIKNITFGSMTECPSILLLPLKDSLVRT